MRKKYNESDIRNDYRRLTKLLIERGMTISTMESATSGQIASLITDTEGSSAVLKGAFVTYCNEAKIMQGVPAEILEKCESVRGKYWNRSDRNDGKCGSCESGGICARAGIFCNYLKWRSEVLLY